MPGGLLIHNLKSGSLDAELLEKLIAALGGPVSADIEELGEADNALNRARENHCDWVAVAGGDGTVEQVASTLIGATVPLGIVPVGTFNNFARSLDLPMDGMEACQVILSGNARPVDVGFANGKPFFECLGSGLDAALYPLSEEIKSGRIGRLDDFLRRAYRYQRQRFVLTLDRPPPEALARISANESHRLREALMRKRNSCVSISALMLMVSNRPYFGMNFAVAPEQRMDDGLLTVSVFSRYSKLQLWWHFASIAFGRREYRPKSIALRVGRLEINGPRKLPVHLDGSPQKDFWPVKVECRKGVLPVFRGSR
jgi:Sphingosine kinase and enzymes related to eukaryotic diacylglycerol kinase